jgi:hypothetical protein
MAADPRIDYFLPTEEFFQDNSTGGCMLITWFTDCHHWQWAILPLKYLSYKHMDTTYPISVSPFSVFTTNVKKFQT